MDVYELQYYKLNQFYLSCVGLWPYMDEKTKRIRLYIVNFAFVIVICSILLKTCTSKVNLNLLIEILSNLLLSLCIIVTYVAVCVHEKQVYDIIEQIRIDWAQIKSKEECEIFEKYAKRNRMYTVSLILFWHGSIYSILFFMISPIILDIFAPLKEPRPRDIPFPVEVFFDTSKYFSICFTLVFIFLHIIGNAAIAIYTLYSIVVQHSLALFALIGYIFTNTNKCNNNLSMNTEEQKIIYENIVRGIWIHRRTIKFIDNVNHLYDISYLLDVAFGMIVISVDVLRLLRTKFAMDNLQEILTCLLHISGNLLWILVGCYFGQTILDSSANLHRKIYSTNWYSYSTTTRKLILIVLIRSMKPSHISIGKMFVSSLELYISILQTSVSYTMVCYSLRQ